MYKKIFKHIIDFILSLIGFIAILPIFIIVSIVLFFANNGKPFFLQERPGKNEKIFKIIKFKTMNDRKDVEGNLLPATERITSVGNFIRKSSLDEIPQLINVIKGEMSIVGPRPLRIEYLPLYNEEQRLRHIVRPGITGWAQINGRNSLTWEAKFKLDNYYVNHLNFCLDIKIIFITVMKVLKRQNINQDNDNITVPFKGINLDS